MYRYAAYNEHTIWGVGDTESAALADAKVWIGQTHEGHVLQSLNDLQVAPMTLRLQMAVHEHGVRDDFVLREDGQLDIL
jgi:hypothetical protein